MNQVSSEAKAQLVLDHGNATAVIMLSGDWSVQHLPEAERASLTSIPPGISHLIVNGSALGEVDTSGAWLIIEMLRRVRKQTGTADWIGFTDSQLKILRLISNVKHEELKSGVQRSGFHESMVSFGKSCVRARMGSYKLMSFFGQLCATLARTVRHPSRLRVKSVFHHINEIGINALPIVVMMAFFISLVLGYQGANQLKLFGAKEYTINLVAISHLREMGVLITAIMLAGRSCSAFAAQLGVMQMNQEIAALRTLGLDPYELLVLPRIIAIVIALPALTFIADMAGMVGTYFIGWAYLDLSYSQFYDRVQKSVTDMTFYVGIIKAPVFAFFIGMIGCYQGMEVRNSATELGLRTTAAVVQSIFWIVLMDAIFSIIFTSLNV